MVVVDAEAACRVAAVHRARGEGQPEPVLGQYSVATVKKLNVVVFACGGSLESDFARFVISNIRWN